MPEYCPVRFGYDRKTALEMVTALKAVPLPEETAIALAIEEERKQAKAAKMTRKAARKAYALDDTASVSSFGSTVSMIKARLFARKRDAADAKAALPRRYTLDSGLRT